MQNKQIIYSKYIHTCNIHTLYPNNYINNCIQILIFISIIKFNIHQYQIYTYTQIYIYTISQTNINKQVVIQINMFKRWSSYSLKMRNARQNYVALLRARIKTERAKIMTNMSRRIKHGILFGSIAITGYYIGNQMYSQHLQKKKMKKKLMKSYPQQTYIISFDQDPMLLLQQVSVTSTQDKQQVNHLANHHCIYINQNNNSNNNNSGVDIKKIKQKLGGTIIVFSPRSIDQLCHALHRCHKYRHSAIVGYYPIPQPNITNSNNTSTSNIANTNNPSAIQTTNNTNSTLQYYKLLQQSLNKISEPIHKDKYLVIDLSQYKSIQIDPINDIIQSDTGTTCKQLNNFLINSGFQPLFQQYSQNLSIYQVISNNLPLLNNGSLNNQLHNLSLVSADGVRFKSSTQVQKFGQIPNLTSLFIGTGGAFAIPAQVQLKINRHDSNKINKYYSIQSENLSQLIIKWRQFREYLAMKKINYQLYIDDKSKIMIQTEQPISLGEYIGYKQQPNYHPNNNNNNNKHVEYIFSINNKILQKIILNNSHSSSQLMYNKNILKISIQNSKQHKQQNVQQLRKLISDITLQGGVLIWCKDKQKLNSIKQRIDLTQTGAQLMKKIVQVRQGIDQRHVLHAHDRYEKYYAKGMFRKFTQFFW